MLIYMHHPVCASGPLHIQFPASQTLFSLLNDTHLLYQSLFKGHIHRKAFCTAVCKVGHHFILLFLILNYCLQNSLSISDCVSLFNISFFRLLCKLQQKRNCGYFPIPGKVPGPWLMLHKKLSDKPTPSFCVIQIF